jgi:hypothetical protein
MVLKLGHCIECIMNIWEVLKCGAGEEWRRSVGPIEGQMKKYYTEYRRRGISYIQYKEGWLTGLVTSCVGTAF